jgi:hypothetical protein
MNNTLVKYFDEEKPEFHSFYKEHKYFAEKLFVLVSKINNINARINHVQRLDNEIFRRKFLKLLV